MTLGTEQTDRGISALVGRMADGFSRLVSQHITLARMELAEDAKAMALDAGRVIAFVPFLLVGYLFFCGAIAVALAQAIGYGWALGAVSFANLAAGGFGIWHALSRLKTRHVMDDSAQELTRSMAVLSTTSPPVVPQQPRNVFKEPPNAQ